jgi:hypothetical protein
MGWDDGGRMLNNEKQFSVGSYPYSHVTARFMIR